MSETVTLCKICAKDPSLHKFSLANGHDYGRKKHFPNLTGTTLSVVLPVRNYNIDVMIKDNHSTGHSICFPSDGPTEAVKVLPCTDMSRLPLVTFLGPSEKWRKQHKQWKQVYEIDVDKAYKALRIWKCLNNPAFLDIEIDDSQSKVEELGLLGTIVESEMVMSTNEAISGISEFVDSEDLTSSEEELADSNEISVINSAVLPSPSLAMMENNMGVNALLKLFSKKKKRTPKAKGLAAVPPGLMSQEMLDMIALQDKRRQGDPIHGEESDESDQEEDEEQDDEDDEEEENAPLPRPVIPVTRDGTPISEWDENDKLTRGAFPHLFLLGKGLPKGEMTQAFVGHCFKYYDGRFEDSIWISTMFNQKQRHACIRKSAKLGISKPEALEKFAKLANCKDFREKLIKARDNPILAESKALNTKICRILSMVGKAVPFSPFERIATRPMLQAMRLRYSAASVFHTGAPPEFEDATVLRLSLIKQFNDPNCKLSQSGFERKDLPESVLKDAGKRMYLTKSRPILAAQSFMRIQRLLDTDIIMAPSTYDTKISRNYTERKRGAFGAVAAHNTVVEPQAAGRLHWHKMIYLSALTPTLLSRLSAGPTEVVDKVASFLQSLTCTTLTTDIYKWGSTGWDQNHEWVQCPDNATRPRAADIPVCDAQDDYEGYLDGAMKKCLLTNMHTHGFTCEKTRKGKWMCRLALPRGVHDNPTTPLLIQADSLGDMKKGIPSKLNSIEVITMINLSCVPFSQSLSKLKRCQCT